jgi:UDP-N-acetylglucosamine 2-epimerase
LCQPFEYCRKTPFLQKYLITKSVKSENYCDVITPIIVHPGQHYDRNMSGEYFDNLGIQAVEIGSKTLVGNKKEFIMSAVNSILSGPYKKGGVPELWDGKASTDICRVYRLQE